jgi:hypothetical protein
LGPIPNPQSPIPIIFILIINQSHFFNTKLQKYFYLI